MTEFLPLCDVLFNVISLAGYFCDVVFDVVFGYALFERGKTTYFAIVITLVTISLLVSQVVSLKWFFNKLKIRTSEISARSLSNKEDEKQCNKSVSRGFFSSSSTAGRYIVIILHCTQMGVLWRYAKLFVPVDLRHVKHEVRDLCMLRLVHAFCEAAPMLLLQLHVLITMDNENELGTSEIKVKSFGSHVTSTNNIQQSSVILQQQRTFKDLNVVSAILSLFSVCWALASFSKNVRLQNVHRLVLTWLGVIFQFLWRLGTIISRITSLTVYASLYNHWIFLVIILHWMSMLLWLISPKNVFHGERISRLRKAVLAGLIAFIYVFAYINLQEVNHRQKMVTFYVVMFLENLMLVCLWLIGIWSEKPQGWYWMPVLVFSSFFIGMLFMLLYYKYFHVRRLGYEAGGRYPDLENYNKCVNCSFPCKCATSYSNDRTLPYTGIDASSSKYPHVIPGVFNCRFTNPVGNGATKRKKKKPTSFIPPPILGLSCQQINNDIVSGGPMAVPFWKRQLPSSQHGGSSENEGSVGSRVNIHQKLQEKKQKQLAELKVIEEEIKQGKLGGPATGTLSSGDDGRTSLPRQPIPRTKKHINLDPIEWRATSPEINVNSFSDRNILLAANLDEINNLDKYTDNFDAMYNSFMLKGINIPILGKFTTESISIDNNAMTAQQLSTTENNSLTRNIVARTKMPHNTPRNPFAENYRGNFVNMYAEASTNNNRPPSISPRNTANSPNRTTLYDHHSGLYLEVNHPRQISGTYSSSVENSGLENLPFPYNVVPPPRNKLDSRGTPKIATALNQQNNLNIVGCNNAVTKLTQRQIHRAKTPEILLAPHYLENSRVYYDWVTREPVYRLSEMDRSQTLSSGDENLDISAVDESLLGSGPNGHRIPSDIDSQVSLPRSYTLPREFKYYRRNKGRKLIKNDHFITSNNSSDGDVDSGDDNESAQQSNISKNSPKHTHSSKIRNGIIPCNHSNFGNTSSPISTIVKNNTRYVIPSNATDELSHKIASSSNNPTSNYIVPEKSLQNLDLINSVEYNNNNPIMNRPMRMRIYGGGKSGLIRHETKL